MTHFEMASPTDARDLYSPVMAEIKEVRQMTELEALYTVELPGGRTLGHKPGQFIELSLFGVGEAPFSVSSSPSKKGPFELGIRRVGVLTDVLSRMEPGQKVGIRGPFGNGVDVDEFKGKDVLIVAGGIGLVPMRSMINYVLDNRGDFGRLHIVHGARSENDLLFRDEQDAWAADPEVDYHVTLDRGSDTWQGNTGVITTLIPGLDLDLGKVACLVCGPPVMYRFVLLALKSRGLAEKNIWMSLERRMKCGVGKCGHCQINSSYVCHDGPVYNYLELKSLQEAL